MTRKAFVRSHSSDKIVWGNFADTVTLNCRIKEVVANCMVDSGAGCSLITKGVLAKIPVVNLTPVDKILKDASNNVINLIGKVVLPVVIRRDTGKTI